MTAATVDGVSYVSVIVERSRCAWSIVLSKIGSFNADWSVFDDDDDVYYCYYYYLSF